MTKKSGGKTAKSNKAQKAAPRRTASASSSVDEDEIENDGLSHETENEDDEAAVAGADTESEVATTEKGDDDEAEKRGKRQIYFAMAGHVTLPEADEERGLSKGQKATVLEFMTISMPEDDSIAPDLDKGRKEAIASFESKYGVKPEAVDSRAIYIRKGTNVPQRKRETLNVTIAEKAPFNGKNGSAIHVLKGVPWNVMVNFTTDPNVVWIYYRGTVDPKALPKEEGKKNQRPPTRYINLDKLTQVLQKTPEGEETLVRE